MHFQAMYLSEGASRALGGESGALEERGLWRIMATDEVALEGCVFVGW